MTTASPSSPPPTGSKSSTKTPPREPDVVARADYEGFLEAGEGRISFDEFTTRHLEIIDGAAHGDAFLALMGTAMTRRE